MPYNDHIQSSDNLIDQASKTRTPAPLSGILSRQRSIFKLSHIYLVCQARTKSKSFS